MEKTDLRKEFPSLFKAPTIEFELVKLPKCYYLMVDGSGDPNSSPTYVEAIELLYGACYTLKFLSKKEGLLDYVVPPLEGLWWSDDMRSFESGDKASWQWTMMIMVPREVSRTMVTKALKAFQTRKPDAPVNNVRFESLSEGLVVQILHVGPYDAEGPTLARMHQEFMPENGLTSSGKHHEIYLSDPRRSAPERLRTILRQPVKSVVTSS